MISKSHLLCVDDHIRGTFLVDNSGRLQTRIPRGENISFIVNYLYSNPCSRLSDCRRALLLWRGIKLCDQSRGQYASYFYDRYAHKWWYEKRWQKIVDKNGKKRALLTPLGMSMVDLEFARKIKGVTSSGKERIRITVPESQIGVLAGKKYDHIFPRKLNTDEQ